MNERYLHDKSEYVLLQGSFNISVFGTRDNSEIDAYKINPCCIDSQAGIYIPAQAKIYITMVAYANSIIKRKGKWHCVLCLKGTYMENIHALLSLIIERFLL